MSREQQIIEAIRQLHDEGSTTFSIHQIRNAHTRHPEGWKQLPERWEPLVSAVLRTLEAIGVVSTSDANRYRLHRPSDLKNGVTGSVPRDDAPGEEAQQRPPGNRPPDVPPGSADGGDGDRPGAGYREVLSHPSLFACLDEDFNRLLGRIGGRS